jgi:HEAT repeat protein
MGIRELEATPAWEWPEDAAATVAAALADRKAPAAERLLAAELAGEYTAMGDAPAAVLLSVLTSSEEPVELRERAALSLGEVLDAASVEDFGEAGPEEEDEAPITEEMFEEIREALAGLYHDERTPAEVRQGTLLASARAPEDWHEDAIRTAYSGGDEGWKRVAVTCMSFVPGFEEEIMEAMESQSPDVRYEALCAAGTWGLAGAWPEVERLLQSEKTEKRFLLAAIAAAAVIRPGEAVDYLEELAGSEDDEIAEAAEEALVESGAE